jgi:hypothetical protein
MAGVVLQTSIQTHEFVAQWQNQSHMSWTSQSKISKAIKRKIEDLQQAVTWLVNQLAYNTN